MWMYCPRHARVKGNDQAERLASKATNTCSLHLGTLEVLRSLRHYLWHKAKDITQPIIWRRKGMERQRARQSSLEGQERAIINHVNTGTVSKKETEWSTHMAFSKHA